MKTITINTTKSKAVYYWMSKEYGSWEDENENPDHACATLQRFGGKVTMTEIQARELIESGKYTSTAYNDDELEGGQRTKDVIKNYVKKVEAKLKG